MSIVIYALAIGTAASLGMIVLGWAAGRFIAALD